MLHLDYDSGFLSMAACIALSVEAAASLEPTYQILFISLSVASNIAQHEIQQLSLVEHP